MMAGVLAYPDMYRMFAVLEARFEIGGSGCFPLALNRNCVTLGKV